MTDSIPYISADSTAAYENNLSASLGLTLDSLFPHREMVEPQLRESLFRGHGYTVVHNGLIERQPTEVSVWILATMVAAGLLLFLYYRLRKVTLADVFRAVVDHRAMDRIVRNSNLTTMRLVPVALFVSVAVAMSVHKYAFEHTGLGGLFLIAALLSVAYLVRNGLLRLLGNVMYDKQAVGIYITNAYIFHLALATVMTPALFIQVFLPEAMTAAFYTICALAAVCYIMRISRGLKLFLTFSKGLNLFLFYYLCIVELIPLLILIKTVIIL